MFGIKSKSRYQDTAPLYKPGDIVVHKLGGPIGIVLSYWEDIANYHYKVRFLIKRPELQSTQSKVNVNVGGAGLIAGGSAVSGNDNDDLIYDYYTAAEFELLKKENSDAKS